MRWLRPEYRNPGGATAEELVLEAATETRAAPAARAAWPASLPAQVQAVAASLAAQDGPTTPDRLARTFARARAAKVAEILEALASLGQARKLPDGRYARAA